MQENISQIPSPVSADKPVKTGFGILGAISFSHFLNDMMQSLILSLYPMLKDSFHLSFGQIGLITLVFQGTASILQPLIGLYTDHRPLPYAMAAGMASTGGGLNGPETSAVVSTP